MKRLLAIVLSVGILFTGTAVASADVQTTYVNNPSACSCVATFDGYTFVGYHYVDAANLWISLYNTPGYVSQPAVTSISTTITVSGTVEPTVTPAPAHHERGYHPDSYIKG